MSASVCAAAPAVLDGCDLAAKAAARKPRGHQLERRAAGELAEVAVQVRLVVVAAVQRDLAQRWPVRARQLARRVAEAQNASVDLRRQADLLLEARGQVAAAPARLLDELRDRHPAAAAHEPR